MERLKPGIDYSKKPVLPCNVIPAYEDLQKFNPSGMKRFNEILIAGGLRKLKVGDAS